MSVQNRMFSWFGGEEKKEDDNQNFSLAPEIASIIDDGMVQDDSFLKIVRQVEFWYQNELSEAEIKSLTERLVRSSIRSSTPFVRSPSVPPSDQKFIVPKVRFGKTELQMPIVTCGGMRLQETWIPDTIPLLKSNKSKVVKSRSQTNFKDVILACIKLGLNHFETARYYGSSEIQMSTALKELMDEGVIKREDFIFQTKLMPSAKLSDFKQQWEDTWANVEQLGHVDLLAFHCVTSTDQIDIILNEAEDSIYAFVKNLQSAGKVKHVGFSTHGDAANVLRIVNSCRFDYVNVHKHFFGDYHAVGTPDSLGGQGNESAVRRALELDMGVFCISPFDKGGKLYRPSAAVASAIGPEMSPIAFAALHAWKSQGIHTISVGFARPSDLDEVIEAAAIYAKGIEADELVKAAEARLNDLAITKLGKEWHEKGLLNVPSFFDSITDGIAIGQCLWLHNCLTAYGMLEFSKDRYSMLEKNTVSWKKSKTYDENCKKCFGSGNPGRGWDETVDLAEALKDHYDPELALKKLKEVHDWLKIGNDVTDNQMEERGWQKAYSLTVWDEFPGEVSASAILGGRLRTMVGLSSGTGPSKEAQVEVQTIRGLVRSRKAS